MVEALAEERTVGAAIDDLTIRIALNDVFFRDDVDLHRAVSISVVEGRVLLKGRVPASEDRIRAVELAGRVAGVGEVIDQLQVARGAGAMTYVRDRWISAQLETELLLDMAVLHINYDIETVNGVVYLIGIVQEEGELARVVGHASAIPGVRHVADHVIAQRSRAPSACTSRPPAHGMNMLWGLHVDPSWQRPFAVKDFLDSDERRVGDDARRCRRETVLAAVRDAVDFRAAPVYGPVSAAPAKRRRFRRSRHFGQGRARSGRSAGGCGSIAVHFA